MTPIGKNDATWNLWCPSVSLTVIYTLLLWHVSLPMLDKNTVEVMPLCLLPLSIPQSVSTGIVIKRRPSFIHAGAFWVTFHFVGVYFFPCRNGARGKSWKFVQSRNLVCFHKRNYPMTPVALADRLPRSRMCQQTICFICTSWQAFCHLPPTHRRTK